MIVHIMGTLSNSLYFTQYCGGSIPAVPITSENFTYGDLDGDGIPNFLDPDNDNDDTPDSADTDDDNAWATKVGVKYSF